MSHGGAFFCASMQRFVSCASRHIKTIFKEGTFGKKSKHIRKAASRGRETSTGRGEAQAARRPQSVWPGADPARYSADRRKRCVTCQLLPSNSRIIASATKFRLDIASGGVDNAAGWFDERVSAAGSFLVGFGRSFSRPSWRASMLGPFRFSPESETLG